jgi:hypothetical protein
MISAEGVHRDEGMEYAIDNGAWTAHTQQRPWDEGKFMRLIASHGERADFVILPDVVAGGLESLRFSESWIPRLEGIGRRRLLAVQDGMAPWDVEPLLGESLGLFVGGSTDWKWRSLPHWGFLARRAGVYMHVGRVNTTRRILECIRVGADSFDGSSASKWRLNQAKLDNARKQLALIDDRRDD